ncbi:UDP-N-acetylenolpyruvoylglucosamine reductase MurB [Crateriforma conspicua]|uniref:UDP-N-acetylenolpyruvoylglucosamine reductase n=2 Tax=Planctomycetaceae TaxID=126 RepID=A0A5C6FVA4_9PLAN|nr:UDP-N-acetylenolpyruvoylglucosamine reductase MurB [Crateriforma conspicua]
MTAGSHSLVSMAWNDEYLNDRVGATATSESPPTDAMEAEAKGMNFPDELSHLVRTDEPLGPLVWLGIGGPARFFAEPLDWDQFAQLYSFAVAEGMAVRVLGSGSNILVREAGFDGLVLSMAAAPTSELKIDGKCLVAGAGAKLSNAVIKSVGAGLAGLEHLIGIPGTVGGGVIGNASAGGRDLGSAVAEISVLDSTGTRRSISQEDAGFGHRKTSLVGQIVCEVTFQLEPSDITALNKRMQKLWISRNSQRPSQHSRIAMPFVDPDGISADELIQNVGLAGIREGDVSLDSRQPNYLIAHEGATSEQCVRLIDRIREQVHLQTGVDLQLNLQIW